MDQKGNRKWDMTWYNWLLFLLPFLVPVSIALGLGLESLYGSTHVPHHNLRDVAHWFDPVFFQYNLILWLLAILVVPMFALSYLQVMTTKKEKRLLREVPAKYHSEIRERMGDSTPFGTYWGSVIWAMFVIVMGVSISLLFKPVFSAYEPGVNFTLGANTLMMGPFAELFAKNPEAYYSHLIRSLTAFQFGFLGAYVYFIGSLARAYFTLDITAQTFVDGNIRMIVASILALVLSFGFFGGLDSGDPLLLGTVKLDLLSLLPVVSFFFGFYPRQALIAIERLTLKVIKNLSGSSYRSIPLATLSGMSYAHELRLDREGYDNVENLSSADPVDLAIDTYFSYGQLKQWIGEAWLAVHLREDYPHFVRCTSITTDEELQSFLTSNDAMQGDAVALLVTGLSADAIVQATWKTRLTALKVLLARHMGVPDVSSEPEHKKI
tara:strand:+ start:670 stop:1980 length:1311 start_codon:yes stop_codon:yes gene_type:complete